MEKASEHSIPLSCGPRISSWACAALALLGIACDPGKSVQAPPIPKEPALVHTGVDLKVYALSLMAESLYVANSAPGEWQVSLLAAPSGTWLEGNRITYLLTQGMSGPQTVRALAIKDKSRLEATWTIFAYPEPNRPPVLEADSVPAWLVVGENYRIPIRIHDPEGDSMKILTGLPQGATLRDSVIEWTPIPSSSGSGGMARATISASDTYHQLGTLTINLPVFASDPRPLAAEPVPGRVWRIRGFIRKRNGGDASLNDSTHYERTVTIVAGDPETGVVTLRIQDTLSGTRPGLRDTTLRAGLSDGLVEPVPPDVDGMLPFAWPTAAEAVLETEFPVGDRALLARRELNTYGCLDEVRSAQSSCASDERVFAEGAGLVYYRKDVRSQDAVQTGREEFRVWEILDPF